MELQHEFTIQAGAGAVVSFVPPEHMRVRFIWFETPDGDLEGLQVRDVTVMNRSQITEGGKPMTVSAETLNGQEGLRFDVVPATGRFDIRMQNNSNHPKRMVVRITGKPHKFKEPKK